MQNILKELCWFCQEHNRIVSSDLRKAELTFGKYETLFLKQLKGKNLKTFKKMVDASLDMSFHSNEDGFIIGAKVGARLVLELLVNQV